MKISIWQQFSSNHSGFFWVVGTFERIPDAERAFHEMRDMLFEIDQWHRENKAESWASLESGNLDPLPPEKKFAERFGVEWPHTIDWTNWAQYRLEDYPGYKDYDAKRAAEHLIDKAIRLVGRNVIVSSPDQTWMTMQPFEGILAVRGGKTFGADLEFLETDAGKALEAHSLLTFTASDDATADRIEMAISQYAGGDLASLGNPPPWGDDEANFQKLFGTSELIKAEYVDLLKQNWERRYALGQLVPSPHSREMPAKRLALKQYPKLTRDGLQFSWRSIGFHNQELGVTALMAWLEVSGCTEIDYRYVVGSPPA